MLNRKLCRDLWQSKGILLAVMAIIAVGVGSMVGMTGTAIDLISAKNSYYSTCRMADFWVTLKKAPSADIENLLSIRGVSEIQTRIEYPVTVNMPEIPEPISGLAISLPDRPSSQINNILLRSGTYFTQENRDEVIVSEKFAAAHKIVSASFIKLVLNGQEKNLFVVGIAISPEYIYLTQPGNAMPAPGKYGIFWIKRSFAEDILDFHGACNSVAGLLDHGYRLTPDLPLDEIRHALAPYGVFNCESLSEQSSNLTLGTEISGIKQQATVFPLVFLGVAAMVLNVIMLRMTEQDRVVIGTLKAIGVSTSAVMLHYIKFGAIVGLLGGITGCLLGTWINNAMIGMYHGLYTFPHLESHCYPSLMILGIVAAMLCAVLGALRGTKRIIRLNPAEAMHPPAPPGMGKIIIEEWSWLWKKLDFRWQIVMRSLFRNPGRTAVAVCASAMGAAILVMALGMNNSIMFMVKFQFEKVLRGDYTLTFRSELDGGALLDIKRIPGVALAEPQMDIPCDFISGSHRRKGVITGLVQNAKLTVPCCIDGNPVKVPETGLLMTRRLAEELNLRIGDMLTIVPVKGLRKPQNIPVRGLVDSSFGIAVYANYDYLNQLVYEENAVSAIQLKGRFNRDEWLNLASEAKKWPLLSSLESMAAQKRQINEKLVKSLQGMSFAMVLFAGVIFFGAILNSVLISLAEKKREIATFRVLGYYPLEVGSIFWRETVSTNLIGVLAGMPLGYFLLYGMSLGFRNEVYAMYCVVDPSTWILTVFLAFAFTFSAHLIVQNLINKMNWSEALQMKE